MGWITAASGLALALGVMSEVQANTTLDECLLTQLKGADDKVSVAQIRQYCNASQESVVETGQSADSGNATLKVRITDRRSAHSEQAKANSNPISNVLKTYRPNYILPITHVRGLNESVYNLSPGETVDNIEAQFQVSLQLRAAEDLFGLGADLGLAYTAKSFWQVYNAEFSAPFRETNHEPEVFLSWRNDHKLLGFTHTFTQVGFNHQSNGRSGSLSRSWNRLYAQFGFETDNTLVLFKPWYRIPEDSKDNAGDIEGDDNPDIHNYLGYFELLGSHKWGNHRFSSQWRNNLRTSGENRGSIDLSWSYPLSNEINFYLKYFNGYGYSLIDYNTAVESIGIGFTVNDWL